ncbi:MAG: hypothetical protein COC01_09180, partial [Bacteroidetes bacterium]
MVITTLVPTTVHPFASVTVTKYVPSHSFDKNLSVIPFDQITLYGGVPPAGNARTTPAQGHGQGVTEAVVTTVSGGGSVMLTETFT